MLIYELDLWIKGTLIRRKRIFSSLNLAKANFEIEVRSGEYDRCYLSKYTENDGELTLTEFLDGWDKGNFF